MNHLAPIPENILALTNNLTTNAHPTCIITADTLTANIIEEQIIFFQPKWQNKILQLPDWETLPFDYFSPHEDIVSNRLRTFCKLPTLTNEILITPIASIMHRLGPQDYIAKHSFLLEVSDNLNIEKLKQRLLESGYTPVSQVQTHGDFAIRGSIIDLYPMGDNTPYRIELIDDTVESIRTFSVDTQLSITKTDKIELLPAREIPLTDTAILNFRQKWREEFGSKSINCDIYQEVSDGNFIPGLEYYLPLFFTETTLLTDWLPKNTEIIQFGDLTTQATVFWQEVLHRYEQRKYDIQRPLLNPKKVFVDFTELSAQLAKFKSKTITTTAQPLPKDIKEFFTNWTGRILFSAETAGRRELLIPQLPIAAKFFETWQTFIASTEKFGIIISPLEHGFYSTKDNIALITESDWLQQRIATQTKNRNTKINKPDNTAIIYQLAELEQGNAVVHIDHGIGRYLGMQTLVTNNIPTEFITLEYANNAKLYVPVTSLHLINRYSGTNPDKIILNRLGSEQWTRARKKALEATFDVAANLLEIYAQRKDSKCSAYKIQNTHYSKFAASFPFSETPDQANAIKNILSDLNSTKPMDRIICGDVGFGKTEVAMRAAFVAVENGKQVAVLVPTTLLAGQHLQNFVDRFADWPFQIELLSRFKSSKEQKKTIENISSGKADIIIGTHQLLQKKIKFNALGLIIIDEEHRFGVQQKEKLKSMRTNAHILTLTATPIPRTLNMAMAGMRDLSIIATPPQQRLSIKTFVQQYRNDIIQEAILREIFRGGQVYFLHNDVNTIEQKARELKKLVPEAKIIIAHGQMHESKLENAMLDFYHHKFNVLLCSTIIESGIDIPSANTIIINRADRFGLAQLHQLRGRVGRSHHQAYAWLLTPAREAMTKDAICRLDAISANKALGAGFTLATHDLEIRGAGELLGEGQSGNMQAIGYTLYMEMLNRAVKLLKEGKSVDLDFNKLPQGTEVNLKIPALIPEKYLPDVALRLQFYKKIAKADSNKKLDKIKIEMIDRFGLIPEYTKNLFSQSDLRITCEHLKINKLEANTNGGSIEFSAKPNINPMKIIKLIQTKPNKYKLKNANILQFKLEKHSTTERINLVEKILDNFMS